MPKRVVDRRKTAKALRKLRAAAERADEGGPGLTNWEKDFVEGVSRRLETYGSAFRDPGKGRLEEALSARQSQVARVIDKKSRKPKPAGDKPDKPDKPPGASLKPRKPMNRGTGFKRKGAGPRVRDINDDPSPSGE